MDVYDIREIIFGHLSMPDLLRMRLVCKEFDQHVRSRNIYWYEAYMRKLHPIQEQIEHNGPITLRCAFNDDVQITKTGGRIYQPGSSTIFPHGYHAYSRIGLTDDHQRGHRKVRDDRVYTYAKVYPDAVKFYRINENALSKPMNIKCTRRSHMKTAPVSRDKYDISVNYFRIYSKYMLIKYQNKNWSSADESTLRRMKSDLKCLEVKMELFNNRIKKLEEQKKTVMDLKST